MKPTFSLVEISNWAESHEVDLPNVQRSFVWKPSQIENLWDSILRGYPIGAFVLAENVDKTLDLLDGQQRATAICLGFGKETFRGTENPPKVFIDVAGPDEDDSRRYIIRAITKSHPWGYQRKDNTKPLDSDSIRRAMDLYGIKDHLEQQLDSFFPYDAKLPIPLEFFVRSEGVDSFLATLQKWQHWKTIENRWLDTHKTDDISNDFQLPPLVEYKNKIEAIFRKVKIVLDEITGLKIPALYLDRDLLTAEDTLPLKKSNNSSASNDQGEDDDNSDEVEILFIRLNSGGTPLRGEELNYSILKANIDKTLQDQIEEACKGLLAPARFITIAFRLFQHQQQSASRDSVLMRIKPKQFQKYIGDSREEFVKFLAVIIGKKNYEGATTLLEHAKRLLVYRDDLPYALPYPVVSRLSDSAPEVVFMFLYRLLIKKDSLGGDSELHRKMIGVVSMFLWFGKGERQRNHSRLLSKIWPCVRSLQAEQFWSSSTIERAMLDNVFPPIPRKDELSVLGKTNYVRAKTGALAKFITQDRFGVVASKAFTNRDFILYAQRRFLAETFKDEHFEQDDTNVPFDWDHISPNKLIEGKKQIPKAIKEWYNTNGNLRAWPYSLNRIDQDGAPAKKLDPLNPIHFEQPGNQRTKRIEAWQEYFDKTNKAFDKNSLKTQLLDWSFCALDWAKCNADDLKTKANWIDVRKLIINRNLAIYSEWCDELRIEKLIPPKKKIDISSMLNKTKWKNNHASFEGWTESECWVSRAPVLEDWGFLYLGYPKTDNEDEQGILDEYAIEFGLFEANKTEFIHNLKIPKELESKYKKNKDNNNTYIQDEFTLVSSDMESRLTLFRDLKQWLKAFPAPKKQNIALTSSFSGLLKSNINL